MKLSEVILMELTNHRTQTVTQIWMKHPTYDISSIRRGMRQLHMKQFVTIASDDGKSVEWRLNTDIRTYVKPKDRRGRTSNASKDEFKHKSGACSWDKIPKTDLSRGFGYVEVRHA